MMQTDEHAVAARILRDIAKMPVEEIAELFRVDGTTIYRWLEAEATGSGGSEATDPDLLALIERIAEAVERIAEAG
jgi:DNA invertase Pin-like site-specific DNA recombinase